MTQAAEPDRAAAFPRPMVISRDDAAVIVTIAAALALRLLLFLRYRIDSDETQHLHVVWGWAHGLLQYRDFFDNHMPLFHILAVPFLRQAGERPETLVLARVEMLPLFAAMALLTYRIAASCHSHRVAVWATVIGMLTPDFFLCSIEFRTDILWTTCWLASIAILVRGPLTTRRATAGGLALGLAAAVSAKTILLAICLGVAAIASVVLTRDRALSHREMGNRAVSFIAAALLPPALVAAYFAARGAWSAFVYCTVTHNLIASDHPHRIFLFPLFLAAIAFATRRIMREDLSAEVRQRRLFIALTAYLYGAAMIALWPVIQTEHWLPFYPLAAVATLPLLPRRPLFVPAIVALELVSIVVISTPWKDNVSPAQQLIADGLRLTSPGESVIDLKGEFVFRRRATYFVLERMTKRKILNGRLRDTIADDIVRTGAMVAVPDNPGFPQAAREFLSRNFVRVGSIRVAGMIAGPRFTIEVPGEYSVVPERGEFQGTLDGTPWHSPRFLNAGPHSLAGSPGAHAILWRRAAEAGFSPFAVRSAGRPLDPALR